MVTFDVLAIVIIGFPIFFFERTGLVLTNCRGIRVVTCPGNRSGGRCGVGGWRAAIRAILGKPVLRIHKCSGWSERRNCDQGCVRQIVAAPAGTLVPNILARWYQDRACVCCGTPLQRIHTGRRQPGLMISERRMIEWENVPPQEIPQVLSTASPVCPTCLIAETHTW
jgi:hypothetical protein